MVSGIIFTVAALVEMFKIGFGTEVLVDGVMLPPVIMYSGAFLSLLLAYSAFKLLK